MIKQFHPYHIVNQRPWPLTGALGIILIISGLLESIYLKSQTIITLGVFIMLLTRYQWWRDITREATYQGCHTTKVINGLKWGIILFIISEIVFFFSFFWAFFHSSLSPSQEVGIIWPPMGINPFNPIEIPLLNTLILLTSGVTVTWSHHRIINSNFRKAKIALLITILLGIYFTSLQVWEYWLSIFTISDSIYGSTFFITTGFHGLHVIIGSIFLLVCYLRIRINHMSSLHHFGFEAAIWYWHFIDVIWLFLYVSIYWWNY